MYPMFAYKKVVFGFNFYNNLISQELVDKTWLKRLKFIQFSIISKHNKTKSFATSGDFFEVIGCKIHFYMVFACVFAPYNEKNPFTPFFNPQKV